MSKLTSQHTNVRVAHALRTLRYQIEAEEGFDNIVVVDGVPIVDKSKLDKLLAKISKEFGKRGAHIKTGNIFVPWDDAAGKSKGYASFCFQVK